MTDNEKPAEATGQPVADIAPQGQGRTAAPASPLGPRELRMLKLDMDRNYRAREGLITFLPVAMVAKEWGVIPRRVRSLLQGGRLAGRKQENGCWEVAYPYTLTEGRRGPSMRRFSGKNSARKTVCNPETL